jgi:hypothetical protein
MKKAAATSKKSALPVKPPRPLAPVRTKGKRSPKMAARKIVGKKASKAKRKPADTEMQDGSNFSEVQFQEGILATEQESLLSQLETALGVELIERLQAVSTRRELPFEGVLQEAVQNYLEGELVEPTMPAKDDALYPPTDQPLEEFMLARGTAAPEEDESKVTETPAVDVNEN